MVSQTKQVLLFFFFFLHFALLNFYSCQGVFKNSSNEVIFVFLVSGFQVVLTKDIFPYFSAKLSIRCSIDFVSFCRLMLVVEMQLVLWKGEGAVFQGFHLMPLLVLGLIPLLC